MRYLMRAAQRLSTAPTPTLRPAMPSRSPVAEADQRFNLDAFAAHFDMPAAGAGTAPEFEESEPEAFGDPEPIRGERRAAETPMRAGAEPGVPAFGSKRQIGQAPASSETIRGVPAQASPPSAGRSVQAQKPAMTRESGFPFAPQKPAIPPGRPGKPGPRGRRVNALFEAETPETRDFQPHPSASQAAHPATRGRTAEHERSADPVMDALHRAMSWVDGQPRRSRTEDPGESRNPYAPRWQGRQNELAPAPPAGEPARNSRSVTHLEIGKIEVEIVPPAKPVQHATTPRTGPGAASSGSASRRTFGWRQR